MEIVKDNVYSFEQYREVVDKYVQIDAREINFQNRVILRLLDKIFINDQDISIVDVSTQYKNKESKLHTRKFYAWDHTPDLLIVKNWTYKNGDKEEEGYLAIVEIKSPILDPIDKNSIHTNQEIADYRAHCKKVILTDCYEWQFFEEGRLLRTFVLHDKTDWVMKSVKNPDYVAKELGFPTVREGSEEWDDLLTYLKEFV
ncbi:MAG: hypothetical protein GX217_02585 [Clostridiaceae bacterium]|nr:hypothetical protein [Clostridiaceae bacterium]